MTTIVYKAQKYIAADKRWIGREAGWTDNGSKIFTYVGDSYTVYLMNSWFKQMPEKINSLLNKYFEKSFDPISLYDLQEDLKVTQQWGTFSCIVVLKQLTMNVNNTTSVVTRAWKIWNNACEETDWHYLAAWSWADYVDGIMLIKPDIEPSELFELVASKDIYTSPTFDLINISI